MHYVADTKEIREAKESATEAKENIQVANMEKEISGLNDIIDGLDKKIKESNEYYDELIEQTEKYWDSLIKGLEEYKSRWQELADIENQAKMEAMLRNLGITTEDVLNMSESAFGSFKGTYLGLLNEMYSGNDEMISMLQRFGSVSTDTLKPLSGTIGMVAESLDKYAGSASTASTSTTKVSENMGGLNTSTAGLNDNLSGVSDNINDILENNKLGTVAEQLEDIAESVQSVADALNEMPAEMDMGGITEQFDTLGNSVDKVSASISGGNASKAEAPDGTSSGNGSDSLASAIKEVKTETDRSIGTGGGSGATGQFNQLEESVMDVTAAVSGGSGNRGNKNNGEGSDNLVSSIENLGETTTETLGEPDGEGAIGKFGELGDTIAEAENHVQGIIDKMAGLDGMTAECSIVVNVQTVGGAPAYAGGTAISDAAGSMGSGEYHPKYEGKARVEGTANVSGNWSVQSNEGSSLVGEVGYEIIVRDGRFFTVGNNGPEMFPIKKGDIVFNHEQSKELLKNGHTSGRGKAYADGTVGGGKLLTKDGAVLRPLQPGDKMYDLVQKFDAYFKSMDGNLDKLVPNSAYEHNRQMNEIAKQITNNNIVNNNRNVQPVVNHINVTCPGVTDKQVAEKLPYVLDDVLNRKFNGFSNLADQWSRI